MARRFCFPASFSSSPVLAATSSLPARPENRRTAKRVGGCARSCTLGSLIFGSVFIAEARGIVKRTTHSLTLWIWVTGAVMAIFSLVGGWAGADTYKGKPPA